MFDMKIRIEYDRDGCIGAAACVAIDAKLWEMKEDNKASIIGGTKMNDGKNEQILMEVSDQEEIDTVIESARVCPVAVIKIFNVETGEQIV